MATPSMRERLGRGPGAVDVLRWLRDEPHPVALVGSWAFGAAVVAAGPVRTAVGADAAWAVLDEPHVVPPGPATVGGGWLGTLGFGLGASVERLDPPPPRPVRGPAAWLGYYDHLLLLDREGTWWLEALPADGARAAVLAQLATRLAARFPPPTPTPTPPPPPPPMGPKGVKWSSSAPFDAFRCQGEKHARLVDARVRAPGYPGHAAAVAAAVEAIAAGEVFQANLCLRVDARLEGAAIDLFARAVPATRPAFGAFVDTGERQLVSLSPERFLRRERATVVATPIKGTAPRESDPARLAASGKDRAEHVMILDLMRNDLGRVCAFGSVVADPEPRVEAHPGVWHLVSDVRGTLRPGVTDTDVLRATFPPGSVTGAPKVQALRVISRLEATGREAYTGAIGLVSPLAGLELNVAIRTFEVAGDRVWLGAGGGIVADSDPWAEAEEAWRKAAPLLRAAGAELAPPVPGPARARAEAEAEAGPPGRDARAPGTAASGAPVTGASGRASGAPAADVVAPPRGFRRPDPALGVFETLGVGADGRPRRLRAHAERLAASVEAAYGVALDPVVVVERVRAALANPGAAPSAPTAGAAVGRSSSGRRHVDSCPPGTAGTAGTAGASAGATAAGASTERVRVTWLPCGAGVQVQRSTAPARRGAVVLRPLVVPGGLGAHKWVDRRLLEGASETPLLLDLDATVLEAGWATVWALEDGVLTTPPADGRLLPGVTRAALLADPAVPTREAPLDLARLRAADAILLSSAVALVTVATLEPVPPPAGAGVDFPSPGPPSPDSCPPVRAGEGEGDGAVLAATLRARLSDPSGAAR